MTDLTNWTLTVPPGFKYDPAAHRYTLDGQPLAGLTRMLEDCGYYPFSEWYTENSRQRGTAVHKACEMVDAHGAENLDLDPRLDLYVSGYLDFKARYNFVPILHEIPICSRMYRLGCTPDVVGLMQGQLAVIDVKSWGDSRFRVQRGAELQTSGQQLMLEECGIKTEVRLILQLTGKVRQTWKLFTCDNPRDRSMLLSLAAAWWDRHEHGLLKGWRPPIIERGIEDEEELAWT